LTKYLRNLGIPRFSLECRAVERKSGPGGSDTQAPFSPILYIGICLIFPIKTLEVIKTLKV
jgi:hypothetical protein